MDKKSKIFFAVFFVLIVGSIAATYYRYMVLRDYIVEAEADCDPYTEQCFIYVCDPEAGEECTGDPAEDTSYYKLIHRNAKNIPLCDPAAEDCDALICPEGEADCSITLCDPVTAEDGTECNDPDVYTLENPVVEDGEGAMEDSSTEEEGLDTPEIDGSDNADIVVPEEGDVSAESTAPESAVIQN